MPPIRQSTEACSLKKSRLGVLWPIQKINLDDLDQSEQIEFSHKLNKQKLRASHSLKGLIRISMFFVGGSFK